MASKRGYKVFTCSVDCLISFSLARLQRQVRDLRDDISEAERKESEQAKRRKTAVSLENCHPMHLYQIPLTGDRA